MRSGKSRTDLEPLLGEFLPFRSSFFDRASQTWSCILRRRPLNDGTIVAQSTCMPDALLETAAMSCPACGSTVTPEPDSTWVVAWYSCPQCGHDWSTRIRNGLPDPALDVHPFTDAWFHKETS
jgi:predicted RNA-binding Zn-ribbon protein involved in translation (DUF1610 family)